MAKLIDMTGWIMSEHGVPGSRLIVIERAENSKDGHPKWLCECSCSNHKQIIVDARSLRNGETKSCGCLARELASQRLKKYNIYENKNNYVIGYVLTTDYEFYVDKEYYPIIKHYCWHKHKDGYLRTCIGHKTNGGNIYKLMHVMIMELAGFTIDLGEEIDHKNGVPNDNRIENLRIVTHCNNMKNEKLYNNNTSGHKGVYWDKRAEKWKACITSDSIVYCLGTFNTKREAIMAREKAEEKYHKEYNRNPNDLMNGTR